MSRKRLAQLVLVVAALSVFLALSRRWPKDRTFHFVLGDAAPRIEEVSIRYDEANAQEPAKEPDRVATFRFARGQAPRVVTHEARLAEGDYALEIEVASRGDTITVTRTVRVEGATTTTVDLSRDLARGLAPPPHE